MGKEQAIVCENLAVFRQPSVLAWSIGPCTCMPPDLNVICSVKFCITKDPDYSDELKSLRISLMVISVILAWI